MTEKNKCISHSHFGDEWDTLSDKVKNHICDLEQRADPAGDVQTIASLTEQRDALLEKEAGEVIKELEISLKTVKPGDMVVLKHRGTASPEMEGALKRFTDTADVQMLILGQDIDEVMVVRKVGEIEDHKQKLRIRELKELAKNNTTLIAAMAQTLEKMTQTIEAVGKTAETALEKASNCYSDPGPGVTN